MHANEFSTRRYIYDTVANVDCYKKLRRVELLTKLHVRATWCHLTYGITHSVTCHPTQVNIPRLNPNQRPLPVAVLGINIGGMAPHHLGGNNG